MSASHGHSLPVAEVASTVAGATSVPCNILPRPLRRIRTMAVSQSGPATSPKPMAEKVLPSGEFSSFIPYPPVGDHLDHVPIHTRPELHYYISRMGFLPYTIRLYLHTPWAANELFQLNNAIMRDERGALSEEFKYRLAMVASRDNQCTYC